jgi:hypothetical protein
MGSMAGYYEYENVDKPSDSIKRQYDVHVTVHRVKFLIIKPTRCTNSSNLFLE